MRKAQVQSQVVTYLFLALVVMAIMYFGYKGYADMRNRDKESTYVFTQTKMEIDIDKVRRNIGALEVKEYNLPEEVRKVCFYDYETPQSEFNETTHPLYYQLVQGGENIFFVKNDLSVPRGMKAGKIKFNNQFGCINITQSVLRIRLEGGGNYAIIHELE